MLACFPFDHVAQRKRIHEPNSQRVAERSSLGCTPSQPNTLLHPTACNQAGCKGDHLVVLELPPLELSSHHVCRRLVQEGGVQQVDATKGQVRLRTLRHRWGRRELCRAAFQRPSRQSAVIHELVGANQCFPVSDGREAIARAEREPADEVPCRVPFVSVRRHLVLVPPDGGRRVCCADCALRQCDACPARIGVAWPPYDHFVEDRVGRHGQPTPAVPVPDEIEREGSVVVAGIRAGERRERGMSVRCLPAAHEQARPTIGGERCIRTIGLRCGERVGCKRVPAGTDRGLEVRNPPQECTGGIAASRRFYE